MSILELSAAVSIQLWRPSTHHTWSELESVDVFIMLLVLGWEGHSHIANAFLYPQI